MNNTTKAQTAAITIAILATVSAFAVIIGVEPRIAIDAFRIILGIMVLKYLYDIYSELERELEAYEEAQTKECREAQNQYRTNQELEIELTPLNYRYYDLTKIIRDYGTGLEDESEEKEGIYVTVDWGFYEPYNEWRAMLASTFMVHAPDGEVIEGFKTTGAGPKEHASVRGRDIMKKYGKDIIFYCDDEPRCNAELIKVGATVKLLKHKH